MADNYIEKKFEEYKQGRMKMIHAPKKTRAVFVADGLSGEGEETVRKLSAMPDVGVAFGGTDRKRGNMLAQSTGSRFYLLGALTLPQAIEQAKAHWSQLPFEVIGT